MPGPLTYAGIALLARDRLGQIRDALDAKIKNGLTVNDIERQVLYLANHAHDMMSATQPAIEPPMRLYGPPLTDHVSKFVLLGAVGPDLPKYSAMFAPGQRWLYDALHKGNPDENREMVLARSTDLVFEFWRQIRPLIEQEFAAEPSRQGALQSMRAYVLGHLCHVAADVVSHPYVDDVESHLGVGGRAKLTRDQVSGAIDAAVAAKFFHRDHGTRGKEWSSWWPSPGDVPSSFYKAYHAAIEHVYGPGARRFGFGAFEERFASDQPPALSIGLLEDGFSTFRNVVQSGVTWDFIDWLGGTALMFLPALLALPVAAALPQGRGLFREGAVIDREVATYEVVVFPFAATSILPLTATLLLSFSYLGVGREMVTGWVSAGIQVTGAVGFFASLGSAGAARWIFFFVLPVVVELLHIIYVLARGGGDKRHLQLALSSLLHLGLSAVFLLMYAAFLHKAVEGLTDEKFASGAFWGFLALWFVILLALWFLTSLLMRYLVTDRLADDAANRFATERRHYVRLFDDTTLYREPRGTSPTLADLMYPSGRRKLLKLWWEGPGPALTVRSDRDRLVFRFTGGAPAADQTVFAPIAPTKPSEFALYLMRTVKDAGNKKNLKAKVFYPDDLDYELPPGEIFSDHGDEKTTEEEHDREASQFKAMGTSEDTAFVLYHGPKARQAVRFSRTGPVVEEDRTADAASVVGSTVTSQPAPNARQITGTPGSFFTRLFRAGDVVETIAPAPAQRRIVVSVDSDTQITVSTPFAPALGGATYKRAGQNRTVDLPSPAGWTVTTPAPALVLGPNDIVASAGTLFGSMFRPGDTIRVRPPAVPPGAAPPPQERRIVAVLSDTILTLEAPLVPPVTVASPFDRVGDETADGYNYLGDADDSLFTGETIMNHAADLATLLCLGAASRLMDEPQHAAGAVGTTFPLNKVYQVFRNWNLDRRRENEWKMLVLGGAVSEKRGDLTAPDVAAPVEAGWTMLSPKGEAIANGFGWVTLLTKWLDMARRPTVDGKARTAFRPGDPTNLDLSRAIAFLFDMRDPDPTAP